MDPVSQLVTGVAAYARLYLRLVYSRIRSQMQ